MTNIPSITKCTAYIDNGSRLADKVETVAEITVRLFEEYEFCRDTVGYSFSITKLLKGTMSPSLITAFKDAAIKRGVLIPCKNGEVTYRKIEGDKIAEPNILRTKSLLQEATKTVRTKRYANYLKKQSDRDLIKELFNRICNDKA